MSAKPPDAKRRGSPEAVPTSEPCIKRTRSAVNARLASGRPRMDGQLGRSKGSSGLAASCRWSMSPRQESVIVLGVVLALLCAGCGGGRLGAAELLQQSKSLQSDAAEGALLAQDAGSGKSTRIFTRERASELSKAAAASQASLKAAKAENGLDRKLRLLARVAARVNSDLIRLGDASSGEQRTLAGELHAAALESRRIGESLQ